MRKLANTILTAGKLYPKGTHTLSNLMECSVLSFVKDMTPVGIHA